MLQARSVWDKGICAIGLYEYGVQIGFKGLYWILWSLQRLKDEQILQKGWGCTVKNDYSVRIIDIR